LKYCRNLRFEETPDYNYLRDSWLNVIQKIYQ
jgi:hypothetical protein